MANSHFLESDRGLTVKRLDESQISNLQLCWTKRTEKQCTRADVQLVGGPATGQLTNVRGIPGRRIVIQATCRCQDRLCFAGRLGMVAYRAELA